MQMSEMQLTKRRLLGGIAIAAAAAALVACNDSKDAADASSSGKTMADGAPMDPQGDNAASRTLPLGTTAKVTNVETGKTAAVTIEDRGP